MGWRGGGSRRREEEKKTGKQKGTLAAKLSLNIISLSLVHYLFNKLLRAELAVHGQEVTHYAFYNNASRGYWQGMGQHAKRWMKKRIEKEGSSGRYLEVEGGKITRDKKAEDEDVGRQQERSEDVNWAWDKRHNCTFSKWRDTHCTLFSLLAEITCT